METYQQPILNGLDKNQRIDDEETKSMEIECVDNLSGKSFPPRDGENASEYFSSFKDSQVYKDLFIPFYQHAVTELEYTNKHDFSNYSLFKQKMQEDSP